MDNHMKPIINLNAVYAASGDVVVRHVQNEMIIIPPSSGIDSEHEPFFLNSTGKLIWQRLDGHKNLMAIVKDLAIAFNTPADIIEKDVIEFVKILLARRMIDETSRTSSDLEQTKQC
jgi:hypothetical protein